MKYLTYEGLIGIFNGIKSAKIGVVADFCADIYWHADMRLSELSRETPFFPLPVVDEICSLGAGGNVANNVAALGAQVSALTLLGNDWRGDIVKRLAKEKIDLSLAVSDDDFCTYAYCKPIRHGISDVVCEDARLDFENRKEIPQQTRNRVLENLHKLAETSDVLVVCDQFEHGLFNNELRRAISEIAKNKLVFVDSRANLSGYSNVIMKPNEFELCRLLGVTEQGLSNERLLSLGAELSSNVGKPLIVTAGERGAFVFDGRCGELVETIQEKPPIDIVGAGDTFLSAVSAASASGATLQQAVEFGHLASGVTVKKLFTTGTANAEEIIAKFNERQHGTD